MQAPLTHGLANPLTLDALQGSILSPYCEGFTWINLNQKDLPKEKHISFTVNFKNSSFPKPNYCVIVFLNLSEEREAGREQTAILYL